MKFSEDKKVSFDYDSHIYLLGAERLESVTSYIRRHTNVFDAPKEAIKYAKKKGLNADEVISAWKLKGEQSREAGTATHLVFEKYFETGRIEMTGQYKKELVAEKIIEDLFLTKRLIPVKWEYIVYDNEKAGQLDLIAKNSNNQHFIFDWKTNDSIKKDSWGRFMLGEYSNIPDASFYHYSLQTHLYKKMCNKYDIKKSFIVHIQDEVYNFITPYTFK